MRRFVNFVTSLQRKPQSDLSQTIRGATVAIHREAEKDRTIRILSDSLIELEARDRLQRIHAEQDRNEFEEAARMSGAGPWRLPGVMEVDGKRSLVRESASPILSAQGAYGDTELALQNVEWRREINLSWLEFSRWGIQQIILISRLYFIKNPLIQRGINVAAQYVFGRGVEISSTDEAADEVLKDFVQRNKRTMGQIGLAELERAKYYDGNIFWILFPDALNKGDVNIRTIDPIEVTEIVTNPDDTSEPWYYRREWIQKNFDPRSGAFSEELKKAWYPALDYEKPEAAPDKINGIPVMWDSPVLHRRCGGVAKWHFGCPLVYAALDWAKTARRFLEACMTIRQSLAQFSMTLTTKGGQQALQGAKQQLATTVGPSGSIWDQNPTAVDGAIFASGPGTKLEAFNSKGAGGDPAEVREYKLMVAMTFGIPESFFSDMNTSNLATATSLDRPTELNFMEKQECWREDLCTICEYVLKVSYGAPSGKLREAMRKRNIEKVSIREAARVRNAKGRMVYESTAVTTPGEVKITITFPTIIEADVPAMVEAAVKAATFGNKAGEVVGMDEKETVRLMYQLNGIENAEEILELQYPTSGENKYDPVRKPEPDVPEGQLDPATGRPVKPAAIATGKAAAAKEAATQLTAMKNAISRVGKAIRVWEAENDPQS